MSKPLYPTAESKAQLLRGRGVEVVESHSAGFRDEHIIRIKGSCEYAVNIFDLHGIEIRYVNHIQPCDKLTGKPQGDAYYVLVVAV